MEMVSLSRSYTNYAKYSIFRLCKLYSWPQRSIVWWVLFDLMNLNATCTLLSSLTLFTGTNSHLCVDQIKVQESASRSHGMLTAEADANY